MTSVLGDPFFTLLLALAAARGVLSGVYEFSGDKRAVLPLFRRGFAARAIEGDLRQQLERAAGEAGVCRQL